MANVYVVNEILYGGASDKPDPTRNIILWIDKDTGLQTLSDGTTWRTVGGSGGGSITDATTSAIGGVEVDHARSGAHSVALTTDGLALPAGMIGTASTKAAAGNDARLSDARTPTAHGATHVGAGGDVVYPGLTSDDANGVIVQHALAAGDVNAALVPDFHILFGKATLTDSPGNNVDGDNVFQVSQTQPVPSGGFGPPMIVLLREGDISAQDYSAAMIRVIDTTASTQSVIQFIKQNVTLLELGVKPSIAGALSTVTDPAAKAVLTSIIAALTGIKVATNDTT